MTTTRIFRIWALAAVAFVLGGGCGEKKKEITELQRKEAAHHVSEAQFALTMRDYARAETSLAKAVELTPDEGAWWISLGAARLKLGKRDGAKAAYQDALTAYEAEAKRSRNDPGPWLQQVQVLALLGRKDDARDQLEKTVKQFPGHRDVKLFVEGKQLDRMLADPKFREMAL